MAQAKRRTFTAETSAVYSLPAGTAAGSYTIQAVYSGGTGFAASTDVTHTLNISGGTASPTTTAAANATATYSASSQNVTLSAAVTSTGTVNTGTITFTVLSGITTIGSPWLATCIVRVTAQARRN